MEDDGFEPEAEGFERADEGFFGHFPSSSRGPYLQGRERERELVRGDLRGAPPGIVSAAGEVGTQCAFTQSIHFPGLPAAFHAALSALKSLPPFGA